MTLAGMYDRDVVIVRRAVTGTDGHGNDVVSDVERIEVRALRDLVKGDEQQGDRDQQERTYRYLLEARYPETGEPLEVTGYDAIEDGDETFEIDGEPEVGTQRHRGRAHHLELTATRFGPKAPEVEGS